MAMEGLGNRGRVLRATLCEIERGVFFASYPDAGPFIDIDEIYQVGATAADAKRQIEKALRANGFETVIWKDDLAEPLFAPDLRHHKSAEPPANYHGA